jgi:hypothetical protein
VSLSFAKQIVPVILILRYSDRLVTLNGRKLDDREVEASYIFNVCIHLVVCCEHVHSHDFVANYVNFISNRKLQSHAVH